MVIDIHTHFYPRRYLNKLSERTEVPMLKTTDSGEHFVIFLNEEKITGGTRSIVPAFFSIDEKKRFMDNYGIDISMVSLGNPWVDFMEPGEAEWWASSLNEEMEALNSADDRLHGLGVVPLQKPASAKDELKRIAKLPHLHGVIVGTRPANLQLDDRVLEPFWETAEEYRIPVFIHPHYIVGLDWMAGYGHAMPLALGFPFETTTAATRLILSGVLDRHPDLKLILAHSGGTLPFLAGRLEACTRADKASSKKIKMNFLDYVKKLYFDAVAYHSSTLNCTLSLVDIRQVLFGTDHPFGIANPAACIQAIREATNSDTESSYILGDNARRWINEAL